MTPYIIIYATLTGILLACLILKYDANKKKPNSLLGKELKKGDIIRHKKPYEGEPRYKFEDFDQSCGHYMFTWETAYMKGDFLEGYYHIIEDDNLDFYEKVDDSKKKSF